MQQPSDNTTKDLLNNKLSAIGTHLAAVVLSYFGALVNGVVEWFSNVVERFDFEPDIMLRYKQMNIDISLSE